MAGVISPVAGTRIEPRDSYIFVIGTTATFKTIFTSNGRPTTVDSSTSPQIKLLKPVFLTKNTSGVPEVIDTISGTLVSGQQYEYQFQWVIPINSTGSDEYIVSYYATIGGIYNNFGDEFFTIATDVGQIDLKMPAYATVDDLRKTKLNIDSYLPEFIRNDLTARNTFFDYHLENASIKLREELALYAQKMITPNYKLYTVYQAIFTVLLASKGEDGSAVSEGSLNFWRTEAEKILAQEKRKHGQSQGTPLGRG